MFDKILRKVEEEFAKKPPTIGVIGVSGVGKSTTLNSMFKTNLKTSATLRCTTEFSDHLVGTEITSGKNKGQRALLRVVDAPGLGEDIRKDREYLNLYQENLPNCDVIVWISSARNRAVALDQMYLKELSDFHDKIVFGINQLDLVEPVNWSEGENMPSLEQENNIKEIEQDRKARYSDVLGREAVVVSYSAKHYFNLSILFDKIINSSPKDRAWMFQMIKNFSAKDWLDRVTGISEEERAKLLIQLK